MKQIHTFGKLVKELRERQNLTLREVSSVIGISTSMLSKIEKNRRKPSKDLIEKLSSFFNVSNAELTIAFLSDTVVNQIKNESVGAEKVLKAALKKVEKPKI